MAYQPDRNSTGTDPDGDLVLTLDDGSPVMQGGNEGDSEMFQSTSAEELKDLKDDKGGVDPEQSDAYKVIVVGDAGVGKTCLLRRQVHKEFVTTAATIGMDFHMCAVSLSDGSEVKLQLWDTAGQEQFGAITSSYYRKADGVMLVYDVASAASFKSLQKWMSNVDAYGSVTVVKMVVGNKSDQEAIVSMEEAEAFAKKHGALLASCSAKDAAKVEEAFQTLAQRINVFKPIKPKQGTVNLSEAKEQKKKKGCC